jgi:Asp-tRNA(Asn)/Glu-tRNA(Gln) amidotransferase C subunit
MASSAHVPPSALNLDLHALARAAHLALPSEREAELSAELARVLGAFGLLKEASLGQTERAPAAWAHAPPPRPDRARPSELACAILAQAPGASPPFFAVPHLPAGGESAAPAARRGTP